MRTASPALRLTTVTVPGRKPLTVAASVGSAVRRIAAGVGAVRARVVSTRIALSLSVNTVEPPVAVRAQPSGTFTEKPGAGQRTEAWLSGMSPGGLTSAGRCVPPEDDEPHPAAATS